MSEEESNQPIIVSTNYWRIPSVKNAFSGWLEGKPSAKDKRRVIAEAKAAREAWTPSAEALELLEGLKSFIGRKVQIQLWDSGMYYHELEGPFPFLATCVGVSLGQEDGFPQAYIELTDVTEIPNAIGYSPMPYFQKREGCDYLLASLADLYSIGRVGDYPA